MFNSIKNIANNPNIPEINVKIFGVIPIFLKYGFNIWSQSNFKRYSLLTKDAAKLSG